ncbi:MAG TPA: glycoside hydrolase family 6 protein, partial [Polyangia bacterium]
MRTQTMMGMLVLGGLVGLLGCDSGLSVHSGLGEVDKEQHLALSLDPQSDCNHDTRTEFYAPGPSDGSLSQVKELIKARKHADAAKLLALVTTPHAAWFATGTPEDVRKSVKQTMSAADKQHRTPVLVAYNLPYRDCSQYSGGGATDTAAYKAWIDGFARGIGKGKALVILEPDGLGLIPYNKRIDGVEEWCKPTVTDPSGTVVPAPGASPADRYAQLNYAVDSLAAHAPNAAVYLDSGNSGWMSVGDAAYRLTKAGVLRARGFFLNVSNYQLTSELIQFGTWV